MVQFENYNTGRGSKAHKDHLKKEIKKNLNFMKYQKMNLNELNDEEEDLILLYQTSPSDEL